MFVKFETSPKMKNIFLATIFSLLTFALQAQQNFKVDGKMCVGSDITFNCTLSPQPETYNWSFGDGTTSVESAVRHSYSAAGNYTVTLSTTHASGDKKESYTLTIYPKPESGFRVDTTSQRTVRTLTDTVTHTFSITHYQWSLGDGSTSDATNTVEHSYAAAGNYTATLLLTDENGCLSDTASQTFYIEPSSLLPNVFTPNNDGQNDYFLIECAGSKLTLEIYNRWGYRVFKRTGTGNIVWDGYNPQGTLVSPGTYYYVITVEEGSTNYDPLNGYITVFY